MHMCDYLLSVSCEDKELVGNVALNLRTLANISRFRFEKPTADTSNMYFWNIDNNTSLPETYKLPSFCKWLFLKSYLSIIITIIVNTAIILTLIIIYCFIKRMLRHRKNISSQIANQHFVESIPISSRSINDVYAEINQSDSSIDALYAKVQKKLIKNCNNNFVDYAEYAECGDYAVVQK